MPKDERVCANDDVLPGGQADRYRLMSIAEQLEARFGWKRTGVFSDLAIRAWVLDLIENNLAQPELGLSGGMPFLTPVLAGGGGLLALCYPLSPGVKARRQIVDGEWLLADGRLCLLDTMCSHPSLWAMRMPGCRWRRVAPDDLCDLVVGKVISLHRCVKGKWLTESLASCF